MDITTHNIEESQKKYRLRTVSIRLLMDLSMSHWIQTLALCYCSGSVHLNIVCVCVSGGGGERDKVEPNFSLVVN